MAAHIHRSIATGTPAAPTLCLLLDLWLEERLTCPRPHPRPRPQPSHSLSPSPPPPVTLRPFALLARSASRPRRGPRPGRTSAPAAACERRARRAHNPSTLHLHRRPPRTAAACMTRAQVCRARTARPGAYARPLYSASAPCARVRGGICAWRGNGGWSAIAYYPWLGSPSPCVDRRSLEDKSSNKQHCTKIAPAAQLGGSPPKTRQSTRVCGTAARRRRGGGAARRAARRGAMYDRGDTSHA